MIEKAEDRKIKKEIQLADGEMGREWGRSQILLGRESLVLCK
jgi:hypothetical protein